MYEEENIGPEFLKRAKTNPFRTPDHYFDSIEDRVMGQIEYEAKRKTSSGSRKIYQLLKPVLGLAASFALIVMLAYYPLKYFSPESIVESQTIDSSAAETMDPYSFHIAMIDESAFLNTLFAEEESTSTKLDQDELLAYLSTEMTDLEIYAEIQN
jgi:hypothetical protein